MLWKMLMLHPIADPYWTDNKYLKLYLAKNTVFFSCSLFTFKRWDIILSHVSKCCFTNRRTCSSSFFSSSKNTLKNTKTCDSCMGFWWSYFVLAPECWTAGFYSSLWFFNAILILARCRAVSCPAAKEHMSRVVSKWTYVVLEEQSSTTAHC